MGLILGIDAGNYFVKVAGEDGVESFRSSMCEWFQNENEKPFGEDDMEYDINGKKGFAGTIAEFEDELGLGSMYGETKAHEDTRVKIVLGIFRYMERYGKSEEQVVVVTGQPIVRHTSTEKNKIKGLVEGDYNVTVNGIQRRIIISGVTVGAEGSSAYLSRDSVHEVRILDVGSGTINCATIEKNRHIQNKSGTFNFGTETFRKSGEGVEKLAKGVIRATTKMKWGVDDKVWVCGGISEEMYKYIQEYYTKSELLVPRLYTGSGGSIELHPMYANAVGYYELAKKVYV